MHQCCVLPSSKVSTSHIVCLEMLFSLPSPRLEDYWSSMHAYSKFRAADLRMDARRSSMPVWLDWAIREDDDGSALTCAAAKGRAGYACVSANSECVDSMNGPGYFCRCKEGFKGNPYKDEGGCTSKSTLHDLLFRCKLLPIVQLQTTLLPFIRKC